MAYPEIELNKERSRVIVHSEERAIASSTTVEAIILAKILFELEKLSMTIEKLNGKIR